MEPIARDDFAAFVMINLYKVMTARFRENRRRLREEFSVYFAFLFKKWDECNLIVTDESLDLRWAKSFADMTRLPEESIKECMVEDANGQDADLWNRTVYEHMKNDKSLRILVGHDILLAKSADADDRQRAHAGGRQGRFRYFRRWLSMIVPATVLFTGWADMPSNMEAYKSLRYHPKTMQVIYSTALLLRDVFDLHPARAIKDGMNSAYTSGRTLTGTQSERKIVQAFFQALMPGKSLLSRAMDRATMAVSDSLFKKLHVATVGEKKLQAQQARANAGSGSRSSHVDENCFDNNAPSSGARQAIASDARRGKAAQESLQDTENPAIDRGEGGGGREGEIRARGAIAGEGGVTVELDDGHDDSEDGSSAEGAAGDGADTRASEAVDFPSQAAVKEKEPCALQRDPEMEDFDTDSENMG